METPKRKPGRPPNVDPVVRQKDTKRVMGNVLQRAGKLQRAENLDGMALSARLQFTSELMAEQIFESALALSTMKAKEIATDEAAAHVYRANLAFVRDMVKLSDQLTVLGQKHRSEEELRSESVHVFSDETTALLAKARETLNLAAPLPETDDEHD